jgi:S1-C subfamily serine protease
VLNYINNQKNDDKEVPDLGTNDGVYVDEITDNSAASEAGLVKGDVIIGIDGKNVSKMAELQEAINGKRPGDKATITWLRNKKKMSKTVTMKNQQGNTKVVKTADLDVLGAKVLPVDESLKRQLGISYGLQVKDVKSGAFKDGGISDGFIILTANDMPMKAISDLQEAVKAASMSKTPVLFITGSGPRARPTIRPSRSVVNKGSHRELNTHTTSGRLWQRHAVPPHSPLWHRKMPGRLLGVAEGWAAN